MPVSDPWPSRDDDVVARVHDLVVDYRTASGVASALAGVEAFFGRGRLTVVAGPSGSGKSSLLRVLAGLVRPRSGTVVVDGTDLTRLRSGALRRHRRRTTGLVLQDPADNLVGHLTAREQVELGARLRGVDESVAAEHLAAVGLGDHLDARPAELSGGEQQRVAFVAAAVGGPPILLADEPTAQLDAASGAVLIETMQALVQRGETLVVCSHDPMMISAGDRRVELRDGRVVTT